MKLRLSDRRWPATVLVVGVALAVTACGSKESATPAAPTPATDTAAPPPAVAAPEATAAPAAVPTSWSPEAMEELLAPVALYPDPVLSQVLIASTNPQEVLDAGNWLIANEGLQGKALDDAAAQTGFTPPVRALVQFPQTIDMMCMEMGWTTELGQAFVADQAGVLDAVQRLRRQAMDVGNLQTSDAMMVETAVQEGKEVVVLKPPKPEVVYVPTYDPQAVYAPAPAAVATTTTPVEDKTKYSTGNMITTGLLAFGAGILVNEIFDDDDHNNKNRYDYYYPNYGYGGMPYYPPYPYRPAYGGGYYPSHGYNRPPNWNNGGFQNNGNIIITNPGGNGGYWDRYDNNRPNYTNANRKQPRSPISATKKNRPELAELNQRAPRPMPADYKRPDKSATAANWKGQSQYAGKDKRPANAARTPQDRIAEATPGYSRPAPSKAGGKDYNRPAPKVQGSYAGKDRPSPATRDVQASRDLPKQSSKATRDLQQPKPKPTPKNLPAGDRGYDARPMPQQGSKQSEPMNRPQPTARPMPQKPTAMSGANQRNGQADRAASQRGKQSLPQGARSKGGGGGGGSGKNKNNKAR